MSVTTRSWSGRREKSKQGVHPGPETNCFFMNRRKFLTNVSFALAGWQILPGAGRLYDGVRQIEWRLSWWHPGEFSSFCRTMMTPHLYDGRFAVTGPTLAELESLGIASVFTTNASPYLSLAYPRRIKDLAPCHTVMQKAVCGLINGADSRQIVKLWTTKQY